LTKQQEEAIKYLDTPLLIVAGPGTGKTRVLTEKVIYLVKNGFDPNKILVSTFTIKAANEIKERIRIHLGDKVENMQISTIHSFCLKMLQTFPEYFNAGTIFDVLDDLDQYIYINRKIWGYGLKDHIKRINVSELINFYNRCTENNVDPKKLVRRTKARSKSQIEEFFNTRVNDYTRLTLNILVQSMDRSKLLKFYSSSKEVNDPEESEQLIKLIDNTVLNEVISRSYGSYIKDLLNPQDTKLDFALLQREFLLLLKENPEVLNKVRQMFDYIVIDEYQDTNPIQDAIFKLISQPKYKITVVGDEDQSIYGFRGASVHNFKTFLNRYPNAKKIELEENFRSCPEIVSVFDNFMSPYRTFSKTIFSNNQSYSKPILIPSKTRQEEATNIVMEIKDLVNNYNVRYEDIAILFKSVKNHSGLIIDELLHHKIPFISIGDSSLLTKEEIKAIISLMFCINGLEPNEYQKKKYFEKNALESEILDLDTETIIKLKDITKADNFIKSCDSKTLKRLKISLKDEKKLFVLFNLVNSQKRNEISQLKLFYRLLDAIEYTYRLFKEYLINKDIEANIKIRNLAKFSVLIHKFEKNTDSRRFKTILYHLDTIPENKIDDSASSEEIDAVKLMTIHQAKGLEFPVVILAGITKRRYNRDSQSDQYLLDIPKDLLLDKYQFDKGEELQRAFYVGMSRAEKLLIFSSIEGKYNKKSIFLEEIPPELLIEKTKFRKSLPEDAHIKTPAEITKLSYSSVNAYIGCPFRFYCRDVLNFQTPIDYYQLYGVIVHNALHKIHLMIKEGKNIRITDIIEIADMYCRDDDSRAKWRDELITDLMNYYEKTPLFIKEVLETELPFSYIDEDLIINGQVDLVIKNTKDEIELIDYKSRYKKGLKKMNVDIQLRIYNLALKTKYVNEIAKISAYTFKDNQQTGFTNTEEDLKGVKEIVTEIVNALRKKEFYRKWNGQYCDTRTGKCEFYQICEKLEEENGNGK
jgi:DNA helicase-2/ATP-dependent DNA helicase PcrA